jgi:hypothetical protein
MSKEKARGCPYYEKDVRSESDNLSWRRSNGEQVRSSDRDGCTNFCKYYDWANGLPGETLILCEHPDNKQILDCAFDEHAVR